MSGGTPTKAKNWGPGGGVRTNSLPAARGVIEQSHPGDRFIEPKHRTFMPIFPPVEIVMHAPPSWEEDFEFISVSPRAGKEIRVHV